ncbi:VgrG-related protein [Arthrobacter sp. NPDC057009]|uniref:VgrG-related protein n=1 Tax=Arthrobacter sp. NPDC057009 TaxID=3345996 RepID=UPI00363B04C4
MAYNEEFSNMLLVEVAGKPLPPDIAARLVSGYVDDSSNVPDLFVLRFNDEYSTVLNKAGISIGIPVNLLVQQSGPGGPVPLLSGEITALETEMDHDGLYTIVRGLDHSHRLFRGRRVEAYLQSTAADIVRKVAQRAGIKAGIIDGKGPVLQHVAQDGISDWEFLHRLAAETGVVLSVSEGALHFTASTDSATAPADGRGAKNEPLILQRGVNLVALRGTVTSADQVPDVEVRGWDVAAKRAIVAVAPAKTRSAELKDANPADLAKTFRSPRYVAPATAYDQAAQCDATAAALASRLSGAFAELDGVARGNPKLRAGAAVSLKGAGKPFDGKYTLSSTRHDFSPDSGYLTTFAVSHESERSLYGVAAGASNRTAVPGVVNAVVTAAKDPENQGRVKVKFPVLSDNYESWWARTVQAGAGASRGAVVLPEVGDEVLVAFGHGSFQQPFVLGGLYNGKDKPDKAWAEHVGATDGAVQRRAFVSRTGMVVEFLESPEGEQITVSTHGGKQKISLVQKPDSAIEVLSEGPVNVTAKKDVSVVTSTGEVLIRGRKVTVEASTGLELRGATVTVAGSASAEFKAPNVKVAADATAELTGGATTTVKGGVVRIN